MRNIPDYTLEICIDFGYKRFKKINSGQKKNEAAKGEIELKIKFEDLIFHESKPSKKDEEKKKSLSEYDNEDDEDHKNPLQYYDYEDDEDHIYNRKPPEPGESEESE